MKKLKLSVLLVMLSVCTYILIFGTGCEVTCIEYRDIRCGEFDASDSGKYIYVRNSTELTTYSLGDPDIPQPCIHINNADDMVLDGAQHRIA